MDRVNYRFFFGSTLIAIPTVLVMASLCIGNDPQLGSAQRLGGDAVLQTSERGPNLKRPLAQQHVMPVQAISDRVDGSAVQHAYGTNEHSPGDIQQVIGKQGRDRFRLRRRTSGHQESSPGILEGFFGAATPEPQQVADQPASEEPNWDGVPYHNVRSGNQKRSTAQNNAATPAPLLTGEPPRLAQIRTRVFRGGSKSSPAPSSGRAAGTAPRLAKRPSPALNVPQPPAEGSVTTTRVYSTDPSSRRSRPAQPSQSLNVAKVYDANRSRSADFGDDVPDLVPRVSRRAIKPKQTAPATTSQTAPKVAKKAVPKKLAQPAKAAPQAVAKSTKPADSSLAKTSKPQVAKAKPTATPGTAANPPADTTVASAPPKPAPAKAAIPAPATLQAPKVAASKPGYQKPVDPSTLAVSPKRPNFGSVPSQTVAAKQPSTQQPYAASGGSDSIATTAPATQPPTAAKQFRPLASTTPSRSLVPVRQPQDSFANASNQFQPIGSGVAQGGAIPSHSRTPSFSANYPATDAYRDPYGAHSGFQPRQETPRMATTGQPIAKPTPETPSRVIDPRSSTIPLRNIPGYASESEHQVTRRSSDNFDRSQTANANRMRAKLASTTRLPRDGANIVASELPGIRVVTHGPRSVMIRQTNEYEIRVENRGAIDAEGVLVRALIPDWAEIQGQNASQGDIETKAGGQREHLVWTIDQLPAGRSEIMNVRLMAARSGTYNLDVDWTLVPQKSVTQVKVREPRLQLAIEGPDTVVYGASQAYKVRVLNPGDGEAPNVVFTLSPDSATSQSQQIGSIPPGKEAQFEVELSAQDLGELKIHGLATGDLDLKSVAEKTIRVLSAKIEATLAGPELKYQNADAVYSLQLQNLGDTTSENVTASLRIPSGVKYLGGIDGAQQRQGMLTWTLASLPPGASRDYQFRCRMTATGEHQFAFSCDGSAAGKAAVNLSTAVESIADLVLTVQDPVAPAPIGSEVTYEIVVRNRGSREARDVRAIAQFSHGIEPQRVEGQSGQVVTGQVLFDTIPRIGPGQEVRLRVIAEAETVGHHRFRTEVHSGDTVLVAEEATHYMSPRSDRVSRRSSDQAVR